MNKQEAMERIKDMRDYYETLDADENELKDIEAFEVAIDTLKSRTGEWIPLLNKRGTEIAVRCSACNNYAWKGHRSDFCPNCGADMRRKENENVN